MPNIESEDETFRLLKKIPFEEMSILWEDTFPRNFIEIDSTRAEEFFLSHGWTMDEFYYQYLGIYKIDEIQ